MLADSWKTVLFCSFKMCGLLLLPDGNGLLLRNIKQPETKSKCDLARVCSTSCTGYVELDISVHFSAPYHGLIHLSFRNPWTLLIFLMGSIFYAERRKEKYHFSLEILEKSRFYLTELSILRTLILEIIMNLARKHIVFRKFCQSLQCSDLG